jgi:hypothetical protein
MNFIIKGISESVGECSVTVKANNKEQAKYVVTHDNDYDFVEIISIEETLED